MRPTRVPARTEQGLAMRGPAIGVPRFELGTSPTRRGAACGADGRGAGAGAGPRRKRPTECARLAFPLEQSRASRCEALRSGCPDLNWRPRRPAEAPLAAPTVRAHELARAPVGSDGPNAPDSLSRSNRTGPRDARPCDRSAQI